MNKLMNEEYMGKIFLAFMILVILGGFLFENYKQKSINENEAQTIGKVIEFLNHGRARFGIKYEYHVNGKSFMGQVGVRSFKCDTGREGCVGEEFKVYYSTANPEYSRIYLGKYEQYKSTIEFHN